jgi:predicted nucleic acid-binding protein
MVISNTTPLINFAETGLLEVLEKLFHTITITHSVVEELKAKSTLFPLAAIVPDLDFVKITNPTSSILVQELKRGLHEGEATCLALGIESKPLSPKLILDDVAARQVAKYHSLEFTGTLGCLLEAKRRGIISNIKPAIEDLAKVARFWINPDLKLKILEVAGEQ